jgi:hypothetical protein
MTMNVDSSRYAGRGQRGAKQRVGFFVNVLLVCLALSGCGGPKYTDVTLDINADSSINEGVLLPIDVIAVNESKAESVLSISPEEWFGNDMRERLTSEEIQKLAIKGGGTRNVTVKVRSEVGRIIIYADYENTSGRDRQQIIIFPKKAEFLNKYSIQVRKNRLELTP